MLYKSLRASFYAQKLDFQAAGRGVLGLQLRHLRLCKDDQSNVGTKMASADYNLKKPFMSIDCSRFVPSQQNRLREAF